MTIQQLFQQAAQSFQIIPTASDMILLTRGADSRFVRQDGSQKRADQTNVTVLMGCV